MLDCQTGRCRDYDNRKLHVPDCVLLTPESVEQLAWMPKTCAYRLVYEGHDLPEWHPLVPAISDTVEQAGQSWLAASSQKDSVEDEDIADHITDWDHPATD